MNEVIRILYSPDTDSYDKIGDGILHDNSVSDNFENFEPKISFLDKGERQLVDEVLVFCKVFIFGQNYSIILQSNVKF